jgi:hypothetical protein
MFGDSSSSSQPAQELKLQADISLETTRIWLGKLGWTYSRDKKGYVDGHEREDVEYREKDILPRWQEIWVTLREWLDELEIQKSQLPWGIKRRILVTHDETTFNANDGNLYFWKKNGTRSLKSKSKGKA